LEVKFRRNLIFVSLMRRMKTLGFLACIAAGIFMSTFSARANIYATDIKVNGSLQTITNYGSSPVTISYRLNQRATLGVTVAIWQGATSVATIRGGTNMGLNTVVWGLTNNSGAVLSTGTFSISITAAASGFTNWQQISVDTNPGMPAFYPLGIAVDNNANSPYYGRVVMSCALSGTNATATVPLAAEMVGLYKMNADGSQADEGWYGNANYLEDDAGDPPVAGQMPGTLPYNTDPMKIRIGDDDRIYWVDNSYYGAIVACDMQATTNQIVINENGYINNPDYSDLSIGIQEFDVSETTTTNAAVWLCDNDYPNWGIWMYHLTNGASDLNDTYGVQVVETGFDLNLVSSGGCMIDNHLDIFCGEDRNGENAVYDAMVFTNWNGGVLPPPDTDGSTAFNYFDGTNSNEVEWGYGCGVDTVCASDPTFEAVRDVVINSRVNPTLVACPMSIGADNGNGGGIRVLNAANGSVISITNGASIQSLANLDFGQAYTCAAWDNVGNLYGASTTRNLWRVWSPPGAGTNSTVAAAAIVMSSAPPPATQPIITGITLVRANVTINFSGSTNASPSAFVLQSSSSLNGSYASVQGAVVTGSGGVFSASAATNGTTQFYRISQ
jgi:hypothetical protein